MTWFYKLNAWNFFFVSWSLSPMQHHRLCWNYKFLQPHYHFKLNQRITEMHIFMRILWGKNIPLNSITNQRAALDLCRASPECIFLVIWYKIKRHNTVYISRSQKCWCTHARVHLVSISSIVPAVCARSVRDLMPVAEMKECSCLPAWLKTIIKLSTRRTLACVPTLAKHTVIGHLRVPKTLTFKMRLSASLFLWKWVLLA